MSNYSDTNVGQRICICVTLVSRVVTICHWGWVEWGRWVEWVDRVDG